MTSPSPRFAAVLALGSLAWLGAGAACTTSAGGDLAPAGSGGDGGNVTTIQTVGSGAMGGSGADGGAGAEGGAGAAGGSGGGGGEAPASCEETCDYLEDDCQQPSLCGPVGQGYLFSCDDPALKQCELDCFAESSCTEISNFFAGTSAPQMKGCVGNCNDAIFCKSCLADPNFPGATCAPEVGACAADPTCSPWVTCASSCVDKACFDACDTAHPGGPLLGDLYGCMCNTSKCGEWCGGTVSCPGP